MIIKKILLSIITILTMFSVVNAIVCEDEIFVNTPTTIDVTDTCVEIGFIHTATGSTINYIGENYDNENKMPLKLTLDSTSSTTIITNVNVTSSAFHLFLGEYNSAQRFRFYFNSNQVDLSRQPLTSGGQHQLFDLGDFSQLNMGGNANLYGEYNNLNVTATIIRNYGNLINKNLTLNGLFWNYNNNLQNTNLNFINPNTNTFVFQQPYNVNERIMTNNTFRNLKSLNPNSNYLSNQNTEFYLNQIYTNGDVFDFSQGILNNNLEINLGTFINGTYIGNFYANLDNTSKFSCPNNNENLVIIDDITYTICQELVLVHNQQIESFDFDEEFNPIFVTYNVDVFDYVITNIEYPVIEEENNNENEENNNQSNGSFFSSFLNNIGNGLGSFLSSISQPVVFFLLALAISGGIVGIVTAIVSRIRKF